GRVALGPFDATQVRVAISAASDDEIYSAVAPVRGDGTFSIDGVVRGKMVVTVRNYGSETGEPGRPLEITGDIHGLALTMPVGRPLHIIARNAGMSAPDEAVVFVFLGTMPDAHQTFDSLKAKIKDSQSFIGALEARVPGSVALPTTVRNRIQPD